MIGSGSIFRVIFALLILLRMYALYVKKKQKCEQKFKICLTSQIFGLALAKLSSTQLNTAHLSSTQLVSAQLSLASLGSAQY